MKAIKIFPRYIITESLAYFGVSLLVFTALLFTLRMLKLASLVINKGVDLSRVVMVFVSVIPTFLEIALPLAVLLGVMLGFARLSGDSEIIVIRASGVSLKQLIKPVAVFGILCAMLSLFVSLYLRPWGYKELSRNLFEIARTKSTAGLSEGVFNDLGMITLYAEKIDHHSGDLEHILIEDRREKAVKRIITAQTGIIKSSESARTINFNLKNGQIHEMVEDDYTLTNFTTNDLAMNPDDLYDSSSSKKGKRAREMTNGELSRNARLTQLQLYKARLLSYRAKTTLSKAQASPKTEDEETEEPSAEEIQRKLNQLKIERGRRLSMPFAAFILALLAMPLGIQPPRTQKAWGAGLSASFGLVVFVIYYGILSLGIALAENNFVNPYLAVWAPNIVSALIAGYTLSKMSSEEWQSIAHGLESIASACMKKLSRVAES